MTDSPASLLGFKYEALIEEITVGGVPRQRSVGFTSTVSKDCTQQELDSLLDKVRSAVSRQRIFSEIEALEADIRNLEGGIGYLQKGLAEEDRRHSERAEEHEGRAARGLSSSEQKTRQDKVTNLTNSIANRDAIKARLVTLRSLVTDRPVAEPANVPRGNGEIGAHHAPDL